MLNKKEMFNLLRTGRLGNTLRCYTALDTDLPASVTIRYRGEHGGGICLFKVPGGKVPVILKELEQDGHSLDRVIINESAPDHKLLLQGELMQYDKGLYLLGSYEKTDMRSAIRKAWIAEGLRVNSILKHLASPASYDMLIDMLDRYPGHVVEFGVYDCFLGWGRGHNTVIWEVRNY